MATVSRNNATISVRKSDVVEVVFMVCFMICVACIVLLMLLLLSDSLIEHVQNYRPTTAAMKRTFWFCDGFGKGVGGGSEWWR